MRERLIELINVAVGDSNLTDSEVKIVADYLLAKGVIVPPCKVGDKVFVPVDGTSVVLETKVIAIGIDEDGDFVLNPNEYPDDVFCVSGFNIGKTVFLTREEAEKKLREGE